MTDAGRCSIRHAATIYFLRQQLRHGFQVDLSHRSQYAHLRIVAGVGHRMHQEKTKAIVQVIHDVLEKVR
jgi:hypothetical protein